MKRHNIPFGLLIQDILFCFVLTVCTMENSPIWCFDYVNSMAKNIWKINYDSDNMHYVVLNSSTPVTEKALKPTKVNFKVIMKC